MLRALGRLGVRPGVWAVVPAGDVDDHFRGVFAEVEPPAEAVHEFVHAQVGVVEVKLAELLRVANRGLQGAGCVRQRHVSEAGLQFMQVLLVCAVGFYPRKRGERCEPWAGVRGGADAGVLVAGWRCGRLDRA